MKTNTLPLVGTVGRVLAALVAVGFSASAMAATVVSNSGESHLGYAIAQNIGVASYQVAGGFTVSSTSDFNLDSIVITEGITTDVTDLRMHIYSDNSGAPGSLLTTFTGTGVNFGSFTFTPGSSFTLSAGTNYFWGIEALTNGNNMQISNTNSFAQTGDAGWSIYDGAYFSGFTPGTWNPPSANTPRFSVNATAIPEPSSAFLGLGAVALLAVRRRR